MPRCLLDLHPVRARAPPLAARLAPRPASWIAPPNSSSFSVSVVLPASGCEMMANVRRRAISRCVGSSVWAGAGAISCIWTVSKPHAPRRRRPPAGTMPDSADFRGAAPDICSRSAFVKHRSVARSATDDPGNAASPCHAVPLVLLQGSPLGAVEQIRPMLIWVIFALMTVAVLLVLLAPLSRPAGSQNTADAGSLEVYRDQLSELDAEQKRGVLDAAEAEATKLEISRRLLTRAASSGRAGKASLPAASPTHKGLAIAAAAFVTLATLGLYLLHGSPDLPSFPVAGAQGRPARQRDRRAGRQGGGAPAASPEDGEGWDVIAPVYFKLERFARGRRRLRQRRAPRGRERTASGRVRRSQRARRRRRRHRGGARRLREDPRDRARAARAALLAGAGQGAGRQARRGRRRLQGAAGGRARRCAVARRRRGAHRRGLRSALPAADKARPHRGPTAEDVAAAEKLAPQDQRAQMIAQMVDGLAAASRARRPRPRRLGAPRQRLCRSRPQGRRPRGARQRAPALPGRQKALAELAALCQAAWGSAHDAQAAAAVC